MKPLAEVRGELVAQWCAKADRDLEAAELRLAQGDRLGGIVAFHGQQTTEKYRKALLISHQVEIPRTHDIRKLLEYVRPVHAGLADALQHADSLTPFGVEIRYPGDAPELPPGAETDAVAIARQVRVLVMAVLRGDAIDTQLPDGG